MTHADQIAAALAMIDAESQEAQQKGVAYSGVRLFADRISQLKALAADYERIKKQLAKRVSNVELKLMVEVGKIIENPSQYAGADPTSFTGRIAGMAVEIERLKAQLASIKDHCDEYLVNEDLTAEKAMRLIGRKLS